MKNILNLLITLTFMGSIGWGQTAASFQDGARPYGIGVVAPVMEAASDDASAVFQAEQLPILLDFVNDNLNERQSLSSIAAVSLDPDALKIQNESSVRVYFLSEGAGYHNTLGYTSENMSTGQASSELLIFPDASSRNQYFEDPSVLSDNYRNNGLPLVPGDFVDLGVYGPNEFIDFFLVANGANNGRFIYSADASTNPDRMQHVVAFAIPDSPYLMIGFEDLYGGGDMDYNDIVFAVDIGELNVAYLANPEPAVWLMMALVLGLGYRYYKQREKESDSSAIGLC